MLLLLFILALQNTFAQDSDCDYFQTVIVNQTYYVYSPNYPNNYRPGVQCRWIAECPSGYNCRLDCYDVQIPQSSSCSMDRLLISTTGDPQLTSADYYCGTGSVSKVSTGQVISAGLITSRNSSGGKFICALYAQPASVMPTNCRCGYKKTNRIVNGVETGINEFPMMVGIEDGRISEIKCGGVIISNRYVLTAAHCLEGLLLNKTAVVVGEHDVTTDSPSTKRYAVTNFNKHPLFTDSNYDYDIAILTVANEIQFSDLVGPVCLPFKYIGQNVTGAKVTILGWGTQFSGGPKSDVLRKVDVDVISRSECQQRGASPTPRQLCTFTLGKDACQDDSGGPLLYTDRNTGLLFNLGLVSFGKECASRSPGINTDVPALLNWVVANTPGAFYCRK